MNSHTTLRACVRALSLVALGLSGGYVTARADTLAQYAFDSGSALSTDTNPDSVAGSFTLGTALTGSSAGIASDTGAAFADSSITPSVEADAVSTGSYFGFTLTAEGGFSLDLSNLTFETVYDGSLPSGILTANYAVRSSLDGFSADLATFSQVYAPSSSSSFVQRDIDLSASAYQSIVGTVEFRIYIYDNSTSADRLIRVDNVTLNGGTSAIPEPATVAGLLGCAALAAGVVLRRRRRS